MIWQAKHFAHCALPVKEPVMRTVVSYDSASWNFTGICLVELHRDIMSRGTSQGHHDMIQKSWT